MRTYGIAKQFVLVFVVCIVYMKNTFTYIQTKQTKQLKQRKQHKQRKQRKQLEKLWKTPDLGDAHPLIQQQEHITYCVNNLNLALLKL